LSVRTHKPHTSVSLNSSYAKVSPFESVPQDITKGKMNRRVIKKRDPADLGKRSSGRAFLMNSIYQLSLISALKYSNAFFKASLNIEIPESNKPALN
jgi:hypothetical protein